MCVFWKGVYNYVKHSCVGIRCRFCGCVVRVFFVEYGNFEFCCLTSDWIGFLIFKLGSSYNT